MLSSILSLLCLNFSIGYDGHAHPHLAADQEGGTVKPKWGIMSVCKLKSLNVSFWSENHKIPGHDLFLQELLLDDLVVPKNYGLAVGCHPKEGKGEEIKTDKVDKVLDKIRTLHDDKKLFAVGEVGKLTVPFIP